MGDFTRASSVVSKFDVDRQRRFFGCENWTDEDLDEFVQVLQAMPLGDWLTKHPPEVKRVAAMVCIWLKVQDASAFHRGIEQGEIWTTYG